jgi:hypothetical protein
MGALYQGFFKALWQAFRIGCGLCCFNAFAVMEGADDDDGFYHSLISQSGIRSGW